MGLDRIHFNAGAKMRIVPGTGALISPKNLLAITIKEIRVILALSFHVTSVRIEKE
jgi:hypothetical protein